jgi:serine/threonine protein kinase
VSSLSDLPSPESRRASDDLQAAVLRPQRLVFGRYRLTRVLGRGGMGVVWLARDEKLDRPVALKFLPEVFFQDVAARDELKRETRRSLELTHPNVVRIYDFLEDEEAAAISMEYIDGATLSQLRIERPQRCFEAAGLQSWIGDLCRALDYAHHTALAVHRDLKPGNLMVTSRGTLKVADFGISCSLQNTAARVTMWNNTGGTLGYMSPQQLLGEIGAASDDIYSVGATLYELLTSKPPFHSGDLSLQIRESTPESITARRASLGLVGEPIPQAWEETIAACLAKRPGDRPESARDVALQLGIPFAPEPREATAEALTVTLKSVSEHSPAPVSSGATTPPWMKWRQLAGKNRVFAGAGTALVSLALLAFIWPRSSPEANPARSTSAPAALVAALAPVAEAPVSVPPAPSGGLMVKSSPPGATVTIGALAAETTPASIRGVPPGSHSVQVRLAGFETQTFSTTVRSEQFTDLGMITLERSTATLQLSTTPEDAAYTLRAAEGDTVIRSGRTPASLPNLPTGSYRVSFERAGWPAGEQQIDLERQSTKVATWTFGEGTLLITSDPPGAQIASGEQSLGETPLRATLKSGRHPRLTATLAGYQPAAFEAVIPPQGTVTIPPLLLQPEPARLSISTTPPGIEFQIFRGAVETPDATPLRTGESPALLEDLPPGRYRVVFSSEPWPVRSASLEVAERGTTVFEQEFPHGTVEVASQPEGAEIFIGEQSLGVTPLEVDLPPGTYSLLAKYEGRSSRPRTVSLAGEETEELGFDFRTGTSSSSKKRSSRRRTARPEDSALTKISRSISTFFTGKKPVRKK